ncbi:MAG: polysaccharide biosynthesis tyrosine autokinase [Cyanobacteria bacterium P01_A01_bin.84]
MPTKEGELQHLVPSNPATNEAYWLLERPDVVEGNTNIGQAFGILRRRFALIGSVALIATTATAAWTLTKTPTYEGKFQLLVEPLKTSESELLVLLSETLKEDVNKITRNNNLALDYQALMQVLRSPKVINPIVEELRPKYPNVTYQGLVGNGPGKGGGNETLNIDRIVKGKDESRIIEVSYQGSNPQKINDILTQVSQTYLKYSAEQQKSSLRQGIKFVDQQTNRLRLRVHTLQGQLQTFQQRYNFFNPELQGEQLLQRVNNLQTTRIETEKQLAEARSLYASLKNQLGMQPEGAIAASALSESPQYQQILTRIQELEAKIATESTRFTDSSPVVQSLREERQRLLPLLNREARLAIGKVPQGGVNPQVGTFQNSVRRQLTQQLADVANQVQSLEASRNSTISTQKQLSEIINKYPAISRQYKDLQRELKIANDTLEQLLSKKEALRVDAVQQEIPWDLIMPPSIPRNKSGEYVAVGPNKPRDIALGGVAGILLGVLGAFVLENLQNIVRSPQEVKGVTKLPLLGVVPFQKQFKTLPSNTELVNFKEEEKDEFRATTALAPRDIKGSELQQAFCSVYTRIQSLDTQLPVNSLAITSAIGGEGKSTVAKNLAYMAAQAGRRVLLVDADIQNPQVHNQLDLLNTQGLSEVLTKGLDISDVIGQVPREENLFVVTAGSAGKIISNPAKFFSSRRMKEFIERSQAQFDMVIYDAPHFLGRLDTNILATNVDGVLLVVGLGKTHRPTLEKTLEELKASRISVLGMVTNTLET